MALEWSTVEMLAGKGLFSPGTAVLDIGSSNVYSANAAGIEAFVRTLDTSPAAGLGDIAADIAARSQLVADGQQQNKAFFGEVLTAAGLRYDAIDIADGYRTSIVDLNHDQPPEAFASAFDLVMNVGTSEHILNQANVFRVVHDAAKPGGMMFHQLPASGFANHGYFCYTPRLFCDIASYNSYEIVDLWFSGPSAQENLLGAVRDFSKVHPALKRTLERIVASAGGHSVERTIVPDMAINVLMRRGSAARFLGALEMSTSVGPISPATLEAYRSSLIDRVLRRARKCSSRASRCWRAAPASCSPAVEARLLLFLPALDHAGVDVEQVEHAPDRMIDDVVERLRPVVERRHDRADHRPHLRQLRHRPQMAGVQRRLANAEHQPAALLQHHVGRPRQAAIL